MLRPAIFTRNNNLFDDFFGDDFFAPAAARHANGGAAIMHTDVRETETVLLLAQRVSLCIFVDIAAKNHDSFDQPPKTSGTAG